MRCSTVAGKVAVRLIAVAVLVVAKAPDSQLSDTTPGAGETTTAANEDGASSATMVDTTPVEIECPACAPQERMVTDVVVPFFERDLCKLKYTARSLAAHDPDGQIGEVFLMWVSNNPYTDYEDELAEVYETIGGKYKTHLIDFSSAMKGHKLGGWHAQQLLKLKIASMVSSDYYMVLDAKNTLLVDIRADTFFTSCNQAKIFAEFSEDKIPEPHITWFKKAAGALDVDMPEDVYWPASITPVLLHRETVLKMLAYVGEDAGIQQLCNGPLCRMFGADSATGQGTTEFTTYTMFAYTKTKVECALSVMHQTDKSNQWALSLWRGVAENKDKVMQENLDTVKNITAGTVKPIMFGSQPSALDEMPEDKKKEMVKYLVKIYTKAKLFDPETESSDDLIDCVIGTYTYAHNEKKINGD